MPLMFNFILRDAGIPLEDVRLLRHKDGRSQKGRSIYELWRDDRPQFEMYQSIQAITSQKKLNVPYWASFIGTPTDGTLFVGIYAVEYQGVSQQEMREPHMNIVLEAGRNDIYRLTPHQQFADLDGKLYIDWGPGTRSWVQRADRQDKQVIELRTEFKEPEFPGFLYFTEQLSRLDSLPITWIVTLKSSQGVYLLTCPKTQEQYVGAAYGESGFWGRWQSYVQTGHGGNVALKSRDPSDYQVSILEVAGTSATVEDIFEMEARWKNKLQSREMGLNRN